MDYKHFYSMYVSLNGARSHIEKNKQNAIFLKNEKVTSAPVLMIRQNASIPVTGLQ